MGPSRPNADREDLERVREGLRVMALKALSDPAAAEEVAQESMARLAEAMAEGRLENPGRLTAFARGIARHVIVDFQRRRGRRRRVEAPLEEAPPARRPDPLSSLLARERRDRVREALALLRERDRELLRLAFFDGLTSAEIAEREGVPASRVRKRKSRALERLRRAYFEDDRSTDREASGPGRASSSRAPKLRAE